VPTTVYGLPLHPLLVHATVVIVPTAALAVILAALWPRFARWAGWGPLALAVTALVLDPLSTQSGETLEHAMPHTALIEKHAHLADGLLPWLIALAVGAALLWVLRLRGRRSGTALLVAAAVVGVVAALGTGVQVVRIGHSGAKAAWSGVGTSGS
jgi:hypothetical protein